MNRSIAPNEVRIDGMAHQSVMLAEIVEALVIDPDGCYIDLTFGAGGHTRAILSRLSGKGQVLACDRDEWGEINARSIEDRRFHFVRAPFSTALHEFHEQGMMSEGKINGIVLDLGVSSMQIDTAERGFSFQADGPLDMRMDNRAPMNAAQWINTVSEGELMKVLRELGEEKFAGPIARAVVRERSRAPITRTLALARLIEKAVPAKARGAHKHPATRSFQAIRMVINGELDELKQVLPQCLSALKHGGRLAVISFHSLEDREVKNTINARARAEELIVAQSPRGVPLPEMNHGSGFRPVGKKKLPTDDELSRNRRARSAVLRVAEKI